MQCYSYLPQTAAGPNASQRRFTAPDTETDTPLNSFTEVGTFNNRAIVIAPDGATAPAQPAEIDWQTEADSPPLSTWISQTRYGQLIETARANKHQARNTARLRAETGGFTYADKPIDSDEQSILRITSAAAVAANAQANSLPYSVTWTCADDTELTLDADGMLALQAAFVAHGQACHTASQAIKAQINAAETLAELSVIDVNAGY